MGQIHILLVDDHPMVRAALRSILDCHPDVTVIGEAGDGRAAVKAVDILQPNVVVMDISMPIMNGIEATCRIRARHSLVTVIGLSVNGHPEQRAAMTRAGAALLMRKEDAWEQLHSVIKKRFLLSVPPRREHAFYATPARSVVRPVIHNSIASQALLPFFPESTDRNLLHSSKC